MARGQFEARVVIGLWDQVEIRPLGCRRGGVHGIDHILILMRAGDRENRGETGADDVGFIAHAAGDDDAAIFGNRFTDGFEAFLFGAVEKAAGVDENDIGPGIIGGHGIAIGAQPGEDAFAVDERLGTAEADHADLAGGGEDDGVSHVRTRA